MSRPGVKQSPTSSSSQAGPHPRDLVELVEATKRQGGRTRSTPSSTASSTPEPAS